jgi:hypothetical protein
VKVPASQEAASPNENPRRELGNQQGFRRERWRCREHAKGDPYNHIQAIAEAPLRRIQVEPVAKSYRGKRQQPDEKPAVTKASRIMS